MPVFIAVGIELPPRFQGRQIRRLAMAEPLLVKVYWSSGTVPLWISEAVEADISAVNAYPVDNNRQDLVFGGGVGEDDVVTELGSGNINILLAYTWWRGGVTVFTPDVEAALKIALANGNLKKLMVW